LNTLCYTYWPWDSLGIHSLSRSLLSHHVQERLARNRQERTRKESSFPMIDNGGGHTRFFPTDAYTSSNGAHVVWGQDSGQYFMTVVFGNCVWLGGSVSAKTSFKWSCCRSSGLDKLFKLLGLEKRVSKTLGKLFKLLKSLSWRFRVVLLLL
jgi:hypothetical protein